MWYFGIKRKLLGGKKKGGEREKKLTKSKHSLSSDVFINLY